MGCLSQATRQGKGIFCVILRAPVSNLKTWSNFELKILVLETTITIHLHFFILFYLLSESNHDKIILILILYSICKDVTATAIEVIFVRYF